MRDQDLKNFIINFSIFGTTFKDSLQNLSMVLKRCMEANLKLIWTKCHGRGMMAKYLAPKKGNRIDQAINEEIPKLSPPILVQHKQSLLECHKIFKF